MHDKTYRDPRPLTESEWEELAQLESVRDSWGLQNSGAPAAELAATAHGVRFNFSCTTQPGYCGDLYVLLGEAFDEPFVIIRNSQGELADA